MNSSKQPSKLSSINGKATAVARPFARLTSRFSASQPFLPVYEPLQTNLIQNSLKKTAIQRLNNISELSTNNTNNNGSNNNIDDNLIFKSYNSLISSSKLLLADVNWSEKVFELKDLIEDNKKNDFKSSSSSNRSNSHSNSTSASSFSSMEKRSYKLKSSDNNKNKLVSANNDKFPLLVKVVKGSYGVVKENNSSSLAKNSIYNLLIYKKCKFINVLCQSIKYNSDKKPVPYGNKLSIPITYSGWFEVLSEDGKSIKLLNSVKEVANHSASIYNLKKKSNKPLTSLSHLTSYLIRENLNGYIISNSSILNKDYTNKSSSLFDTEYSTANITDCKKIIIKAGDKLQVIGECFLDNTDVQYQKPQRKLIKCRLERSISNTKLDQNKKQKSIDDIFNCMDLNYIDQINSNQESTQVQIVYLPEDAKGKFSPIARMENISGVHKLQDILKKFRFPITVQLVYGRAPASMSSSLSTCCSSPSSSMSQSTSQSIKSSTSNSGNTQFSPILRLLKIYEVENLIAYPIGKESCLIPIPSYSNLKVIVADNMGKILKQNGEYGYLKHVLNECEKLTPEYSNMINYLPQPPPQSLIDSFNQTYFSEAYHNHLIGRAILVNKHNNSSSNFNSSNNNNNSINSNTDCDRKNKSPNINDDENRAYKEIDDLYEYVRSGVLPDYIKIDHFESNYNNNNGVSTNDKPSNSSSNSISRNKNNAKIKSNLTQQVTYNNQYMNNEDKLQIEQFYNSTSGDLNKINFKTVSKLDNSLQANKYKLTETSIGRAAATSKNNRLDDLNNNFNTRISGSLGSATAAAYTIYQPINSSSNQAVGTGVAGLININDTITSVSKYSNERLDDLNHTNNSKILTKNYDYMNVSNHKSDKRYLNETKNSNPSPINSNNNNSNSTSTKHRIPILKSTPDQIYSNTTTNSALESSQEKFLDHGSYYVKLNDYKLTDLADSLLNTESSSFNNQVNKDINNEPISSSSSSKPIMIKTAKLKNLIKPTIDNTNLNSTCGTATSTATSASNNSRNKYWYTSIQDLSNYYPMGNEYKFEYVTNKELLIASDNYITSEQNLLSQLNLCGLAGTSAATTTITASTNPGLLPVGSKQKTNFFLKDLNTLNNISNSEDLSKF